MLVYFLGFLGGIALFMYGMQLMGDGLQKAAGAKLQKILEAMTGVLAMGILLGAVVTAVLQASGATTVMTVGLVNAGLLTLKQGFGIIMGANVGTTMTAQLIAFKLSNYITVLIFIGFLMQLLAKRARGKYLGQVILGFGILMLGMDMMPNFSASSGFSSTFTLPTLISGCSAAKASKMGVCMRQGPHQVAQKSTRTVPFASKTSATKLPVVNSIAILIHSFVIFLDIL